MKKIFWMFFVFLPIFAFAEEYGNVKVTGIVSVYDGDTFTANLAHDPAMSDYARIISVKIPIRIKGIDTAEMRGNKDPCIHGLAVAAKTVLEMALKKAVTVELRRIERGKYFRVLAEVWIDEKNVADVLIEKGLALPYNGGVKPDWKSHCLNFKKK